MKYPVIAGSFFFLALCPVSALVNQCPIRTFLTYNTALLDHALTSNIPNNRVARREAIISELRRLDSDVVCLQEVWIGQDVERIVTALSDLYEFSFSKLHIPGKLGGYLPSQEGPSMPSCNYGDLTIFSRCARKNRCLRRRATQRQLYDCLNFHCYPQFDRLPQKCISCMATTWENPGAVFQKCAGIGLPAINMQTINEPGILLLSKRPLINARYKDFHPHTKELIERGYVEASTPDFGKVVCTHTTHNKPDYVEMELSRRGVFNSYQEQGRSERTELIQTFAHSFPLVLAGDFNIGDHTGPLINQDLPKEFRRLARAFNVKPLQECTLCWPHENHYSIDIRAVLNTVIDHVFYKGHKVIEMSRVITPRDAILADGLPLSDHNGVLAVFALC